MTAASASSTDQAALASTRSFPLRPKASRTAATRSTSSASTWPASATLTFAVVQPGKRASTASTSAAGTAGTVAFTGTRSRTGGGGGVVQASSAAASQREAS